MQKINTGQVLKESWTKTRANFWVITNAVLLVALAFLLTNLFSQYAESKGPVLNFLAFTLTVIAESFMMFALMKFFLDIYHEREATVLGMFQSTKGFYKFFIIYTAISLATFAGLALIIIPGIYVILTYSFATYIYLDQNLDIKASISESARISKGHKMELISFWFWILVLNIFGGALFLVGLVVTLPITFLAIIEVYKQLSTTPENPIV